MIRQRSVREVPQTGLGGGGGGGERCTEDDEIVAQVPTSNVLEIGGVKLNFGQFWELLSESWQDC